MDSHDIDIAIDNMTGYQFVELLPEWLSEQVTIFITYYCCRVIVLQILGKSGQIPTK